MGYAALDLIKIDGLPVVVTTIRELLATAIGTAVFAVFVFSYLAIKIPQIPLFQWLIGLKASRLKWLTEHTACISDDVFCKAVIEDIRDAMIFEKATGIYAEKNWRKALVELHDLTGVSWVIIRRARKFMSLGADGKINIRALTYGDRIEAWFNAAMAWLFLGMATLTFISILLIEPRLPVVLTGVLLLIVLFGCAFGAAIQNLPKHAVIMISEKVCAVNAANTTSEAQG